MNFASPYTYFNQRKKDESPEKKKKHLKKEKMMMNQIIDEDELFSTDVNVMSIGFSFLKDAQKNMGTGDATFCTNCKTGLNSYSNLYSKEEYLNGYEKKIEEEEEQKYEKIEKKKEKPILTNINNYDKVWICEFCGEHNKLSIEKEEIPTKNDMIYIIESKNQNQLKIEKESDISIIFCIDNSGSMSITSEIKGKVNLKHGLTEEEYNLIKDFIEPGAEKHQYLPSQRKNISYITRKQCVLAAIESQLSEMKKEFPNRKVGLVTFNSEVALIGDGQKDPIFIAGDKLNKFKEINSIAISNSSNLISQPIKNCKDGLVERFNRMEEGGQTALGPGLLAAVSLATQGKKGSMVIICTDGLANVGLGCLDTDAKQEESTKFYNEVSALAQEHNIIISVITIKGEGCQIEILGKLSEDTNGNVNRVNPEDVSKDFSGILKDEIVATDVFLEIRLHKGLKFRNEDPTTLNEDGSLCKKRIGNATIDTEISFQYEVKNEDDLKKINVNIEKQNEVPFQAQIHYTTLEGHKFMRVITQVQKMTKNKDLAEQKANVKMIHGAVAQKSSNWGQIGSYEVSRKYNKNWVNYLNNNPNFNQNKVESEQNEMYAAKQKMLRGAINKKEKKKIIVSSDSSSSDSEELNKKPKKAALFSEEKDIKLSSKKKKMNISSVKEKKEERGELSNSDGSEELNLSADEADAIVFKMKKKI